MSMCLLMVSIPSVAQEGDGDPNESQEQCYPTTIENVDFVPAVLSDVETWTCVDGMPSFVSTPGSYKERQYYEEPCSPTDTLHTTNWVISGISVDAFGGTIVELEERSDDGTVLNIYSVEFCCA